MICSPASRALAPKAPRASSSCSRSPRKATTLSSPATATAAHPTLYDRDVLAVLPFQSSPTKFVIPVYVMTRDLMTLYEPGKPESDVTRFDLPSENFTIKLGNLPAGGEPPTVSAYDPLRHESSAARLISRERRNSRIRNLGDRLPATADARIRLIRPGSRARGNGTVRACRQQPRPSRGDCSPTRSTAATAGVRSPR